MTETEPVLVRNVINQIRADAAKEDSIKHALGDDEIREIVKTDEGGRKVHSFVSKNPATTFIRAMCNQNARRRVVGIGKPQDNNFSHQPPERMGRMSLLNGLPRE